MEMAKLANLCLDSLKRGLSSNLGKAAISFLGSVAMYVCSYFYMLPFPIALLLAMATAYLLLGILSILTQTPLIRTLLWGRENERGTITFDAPLLPPGWIYAAVGSLGSPKTERIEVGRWSALKIITSQPHKHVYALDYRYEHMLTGYSTVTFRIRDTREDATLYILLYVKTQSDRFVERWYGLNLHDPTAGAYHLNENEWDIAVPSDLEDGWSLIKVRLNDWFPKTFALDGDQLLGIAGYRIRGSLTIAEIKCE